MRTLRYITFLFLFFCRCTEEQTNNPIEETKDTTTLSKIVTADTFNVKDTNVQPDNNVTEEKIEKIDFDFLSDCDSLQMWQGSIVGVKKTDSAGLYVMAQCFANKHYDLIVYTKDKIELKDGANYREGKINEGIPGAEYYAFQVPKKVPEDPENEFDTYDYIFPSEVKIYKLFDDGWFLIRTSKVNTFEELGRLKLNSIYKKR